MPKACVMAGNAVAVTTLLKLPSISAFSGGDAAPTGNDLYLRRAALGGEFAPADEETKSCAN